jgi:non-heme chloroperoxidase
LGPLASFFEDAGYAVVTPAWPDDPDTVEQARAHPDVFANKSVGDVAAYQQIMSTSRRCTLR